jgi:succinoglycan biosynthesis protein ExoL
MRWAERRMLARCDLLILSSPGFLERYFEPVQQVTTPVALVENKLWVRGPPMRPQPRADGRTDRALHPRLGRVAALRAEPRDPCRTARGWGRRSRSGATARCIAMPCRVSTRCCGASQHPPPGSYRYPDALGAIYTASDAVWAQDLWQSGANSDWLLPNRIYEASYFGCPSIALAGTQTGRRVAADGLGFTVAEATAEALTALLRTSTPDRGNRAASARLLARPEGDFRLTEAELAAALSPVLGAIGDAGRRAGRSAIRCAG